MKWKRIYNLYNKKKSKSTKIPYLFIIISIIISVSISLSIPQVVSGTASYLSNLSKDINGGDLKIIESFYNKIYEKELELLRNDGADIKTIDVYSISINNQTNRLFCQLLVGDYDLQANEIILHTDIAKKLGLDINDTLELNNKLYTITHIDEHAMGVDTTSEMFGYCKVSSYDTTNNISTSKITYINRDNIVDIKNRLIDIEPDFAYTTIDDQDKLLDDKLNINVIALSTLNTMCILMSILSIISSIVMIIVNRQKDIAIMRTISIDAKAIMISLRFELKLLIIAPLIVGALISIPIANILLKLKNIPVNPDSIMYVVLGLFLYAILYTVFINIATKAILCIKPLSIIRNEPVPISKTLIKVGLQAFFFTIVSMFLYAIYIGKGSSMVSSYAIIFFILVFFLIIFIFVKIFFSFNIKTPLVNYTFKNIRKNSISFSFTILSIALTLWFILFGFTMEKTSKESYNNSLEEKISYNYMVVSDDIKLVEERLNTIPDISGYTLLYRQLGSILNSEKTEETSVILCNIPNDKYDLKYQILSGNDVFDGSETSILISYKMSTDLSKSLGDTLSIWLDNTELSFTIKGIYESASVNDNYILKAMNEQDASEKPILLIKSDSDDFTKEITDSSIINIDIAGTAILKTIGEFLLVFKYLCIICIIASILFNFNMIYMNHINNYRESTIIRALGIGKSFLCNSMLIKVIISLLLGLSIALGLYIIILKTALDTILSAQLKITFSNLLFPFTCIVFFFILYYSLSRYLINNLKGYEELRDQV